MQEVDEPFQPKNSSDASPPPIEEGMVFQLSDGTIAACNPAAEKLLGLSAKQIQGWTSTHSPWQAIHADGSDFPGEIHPAMMAMQTGQPQWGVVMGLYHPDGTLVWLEIDARPLFQSSSAPYGVVSTFRQISPPPEQTFLPVKESVVSSSSHAAECRCSEPEAVCNQAIPASIEELITLFNLSVDLLGTASLDGRFETINPAFESTLGYSIQELLAQPFLNFVHPDDRPSTIAELEKLKRETTTRAFANRYQCKDGGYKWLEWTGVSVVDRNTIYLTARDITERKTQEAALHESEERWQLTVRGSNDGVWDWNVRTNEVYFSPRWKEMLGYAEHEIQNQVQEWSSRVHPDDLAWVMEAIQDHFAGKTPFYVTEHRVRCKDGSYKWVLDRGKALWDEAGNVVRIVGTHTDTTERKTLIAALRTANQTLERRVVERTAQLQQAYDRLAEREALYRTLAQHIPNGAVHLFDHDLRYLLSEGSELANVGLTEADMIGRTIWEVFPADTCAAIEPIYRAALAGESTTQEIVYQGYTYEVHTVPVPDARGRVFAGMVLSQNVTERKQTELLLRESQIQLQQRLTEIEVIYQSAPIGLAVFDADLRFVRINQRLAEMNGLSVEAHLGRTARELLPDLADSAEQLLRPILATGEPCFNVEIQGQTPAHPGMQRTWLEHFVPLKDGDQVIGISVVCEEITEQRQAKLALEEAHIQLEAALRAGSIYTWRWHVPSNRVMTDRNFASLFGVDSEAAADGLPIDYFLNAMHPDDRPGVMAAIQQAIETGEDYVAEYRVRDAEGQERWLIARGRTEYDAQGNPIAFPGALVDITERKRIEEERQRTAAALRQSESRLRRLTESNLIGIIFWTIDGGILDANDAFLHMLGYQRADLEAGRLRWDAMTPPEWVERDRRGTEQTRLTGTSGPFEKEYFHRDGSRVPILLGSALFEGSQHEGVSFVLDLRERKQAEAALREKQQQLQDLSDSMPQFVWMSNAQGILEYVNRQWVEYSGLSVEESRDPRNVAACHCPDEAQAALNHWMAALGSQQTYEFEGRLRRAADGSYRWFLIRSVPQLDDQGQVLRWYGTATDIHDRKLAELNDQFLGQLDSRLRQLSDADAMIWEVVSSVGSYLKVDRCLWHKVDVQADVITVEQDWRRQPETPSLVGLYRLSQMLLPEVVRQHEETGEPTVVEDVATYPNTAPFDRNYIELGIHAFIAVPCVRAGRWVAHLTVNSATVRTWRSDEVDLLQEIVARLWSLIEQTRAVQSLRDSEEQLRLALMAADQGTYDLNVQTGEITVSASYALMLGYDPETFRETFASWAARLHPDDREPANQKYEEYVTGVLREYRAEFRLRTATDDWKWILSIGKVIGWDSDGNPLRMLGTHTDITDRKQAEQEKQRLLESERAARLEAERANRIKDEFLAVLSHELRSPLNPILGWTRLLQSGKLPAAKAAEALNIIERNARLQSQLIEDLLDISRILRGKFKLNVAPVDLSSTISSALETVSHAAEAKRIQLELSLNNVPPVLGDAGRLQQVIWNLLTNAIKFTAEGGQVKVELAQVGSHAQIQVRDTGKGISPDFLPHVFDHFRQEDGTTTRKFGGLGLGLSIVRQIVELHGGTVHADSPGEGAGATFTVSLPLPPSGGAGEQGSGGAGENVPFNSLSPQPLSGIRILLVDDDSDSREFVAFLLEQAGAIVVQAASAEQGLQVLAQSPCHVLVSDIGMPDMDGYTFIRQVRTRSIDAGGKIPAVALTAYAGEINQQQAIDAGFQYHLAKPVDLEQLIKTVIAMTVQ